MFTTLMQHFIVSSTEQMRQIRKNARFSPLCCLHCRLPLLSGHLGHPDGGEGLFNHLEGGGGGGHQSHRVPNSPPGSGLENLSLFGRPCLLYSAEQAMFLKLCEHLSIEMPRRQLNRDLGGKQKAAVNVKAGFDTTSPIHSSSSMHG